MAFVSLVSPTLEAGQKARPLYEILLTLKIIAISRHVWLWNDLSKIPSKTLAFLLCTQDYFKANRLVMDILCTSFSLV